MKKGFVAITAAIAIAATSLIGTSLAGLGPDRGLPNVNVDAWTGNNFYDVADTNVPGMFGSVMCVACHTRNPAQRTAYGKAAANAGMSGSHFVTLNFADTSKGGGYSDGQTGKTRADRLGDGTNALYMAGTGASATWAGNPKYGISLATGVIDNNATTTSLTVNAQMICESCHNIVTNIGPAKLLATGFANGGTSASYTIGFTGTSGRPASEVPLLCIGCHSSMTAGVAAEWRLHPAGTWTGTHHHRNTGTAAYYGTGTPTASHNMGQISKAMYGTYGIQTAGLQLWGASYGEITDVGTATTGRAISYLINAKMNPGIVGADNGQLNVAAAGQVLCTNCHRAHNAATAAGAAILQVTTVTPPIGAIPTASYDNAAFGMGVYGRANLIENTNPLCLGCHG